MVSLIFYNSHGELNFGKLSLFVADFIQAAGMAMDIKWIHEGKVQTGTYCTVQGRISLLARVCLLTYPHRCAASARRNSSCHVCPCM